MSNAWIAAVVSGLIATSAGTWAIFAVERERSQREAVQIEAQRQAALASEAYQAWRHASRYETFWLPLANAMKEPKRNDNLSDRSYWVKSYQHSDVRSLGISKRYGNAAYQVSTVLAIRDRLSSGMFGVAVRAKVPDHVIQAAVQGEWHPLAAECNVERLDSGEWIASSYKFTPLASRPEFPFEVVKSER